MNINEDPKTLSRGYLNYDRNLMDVDSGEEFTDNIEVYYEVVEEDGKIACYKTTDDGRSYVILGEDFASVDEAKQEAETWANGDISWDDNPPQY